MGAEETWLRTDEAEDVAGSLRHALLCLEMASQDDQAWKWLLLALHATLQGACVCHLISTAAPVGVVSDRNAAEWLSYFEQSRTDRNAKTPTTYLLNLPELVKKVRIPSSAGDGSGGSAISISDEELKWIERLHKEIRNNFVHFAPTGWSIEVSGIKDFAKLVSRIVEEILSRGWAFRHQDSDWKCAFERDLSALSSL